MEGLQTAEDTFDSAWDHCFSTNQRVELQLLRQDARTLRHNNQVPEEVLERERARGGGTRLSQLSATSGTMPEEPGVASESGIGTTPDEPGVATSGGSSPPATSQNPHTTGARRPEVTRAGTRSNPNTEYTVDSALLPSSLRIAASRGGSPVDPTLWIRLSYA